MNTFYITTLGCKVNSYEIEAIKDDLLKEGYVLTDEYNADYVIVNTCCVTNTAASKSRQKINSIHKNNPNASIIVMGCYIQGFEEEAKQLKGVKLLVGTKDRHKIKEYINNINEQISLVSNINEFTTYENLTISSSTENTRAYLKIQDGCNNYCSYCIIPYVRGTIKSRNKEDVINEAKRLLDLGYKEIVLTGIHTGSYGKDLDGYTFSMLVKDLLSLDKLYRLRISSIEESEIDDDLITLLLTNDKLAKHLHIPLQAGSDHVLKLMNRKYDLKTYVEKIKRIQSLLPDVAITTDIIVGFPNETDEDFISTLNVSKQIGFAKIHVFPFSVRKGTAAAKMKGHIDGNIKKSRAKQLLELSNNLNLVYNSIYIDKEVEVLIEEKVDEYFIGHTTNFIKVKIKTDLNLMKNTTIKVKVKKAYDSYVIANMEEK